MKEKNYVFLAFSILSLVLTISCSQPALWSIKTPDAVYAMRDNIMLMKYTLTLHGIFNNIKNHEKTSTIIQSSTGTAFLINDTLALTALHAINYQPVLDDYLNDLYHSDTSGVILMDWRAEKIDSIIIDFYLRPRFGPDYRYREIITSIYKSKPRQVNVHNKLNAIYFFRNDTNFTRLMTVEKINIYHDLALIKINPPQPRFRHFTLNQLSKSDYKETLWSLNAHTPPDSLNTLIIAIEPGRILKKNYKVTVGKSKLFMPWTLLKMRTKLGDSGSPIVTADWQLVGLTTRKDLEQEDAFTFLGRIITPLEFINKLLKK